MWEPLLCRWHLGERLDEITLRECRGEKSRTEPEGPEVSSQVGSEGDASKSAQEETLERRGSRRSRRQEKRVSWTGVFGVSQCLPCVDMKRKTPTRPHFVLLLLSPAVVVYRLPWTWKCSKLLMKSIHAGLNAVAAVLAIISLVAVFDFHDASKIPNMYSLHSWVGLTVVILYMLQVSVSVYL